jgi:hypothetical protein
VFNTNCFADPGDQQLGNAPRYFGNLTSQGIENVNLCLRKEFRIRESQKLRILMEAFNALTARASIVPLTRSAQVALAR